MRKTRILVPLFLASLALLAEPAPAQLLSSPHFRLLKLADGVFAAIASDTGYAVSNAGIIDLGDKTIIFDTFISPAAARDLRKAALTLTGREATYVVDSHSHNDHVRGNQVFPAQTAIVGTQALRDEMEKTEPEEIKWEDENVAKKVREAEGKVAAEKDPAARREQRFWLAYYRAIKDSHVELKTRLPDLLFDGHLSLRGSKRSAELVAMPGGHTASDIILVLPGDRIAFLGDLLFVHAHPWLGDGNPESWLAHLSDLAQLGADQLVPGHGPVGTKNDIDAMVGYINDLKKVSVGFAATHKSTADVATVEIPAAYRSWWFGSFFTPNVTFLVETELARTKKN